MSAESAIPSASRPAARSPSGGDPVPARPTPGAVLELLKPVTWFPPMWAYGCGVVSSGVSLAERWPEAIGGMILAGPLVCAMSQAANDWYDRHVDAINEPDRPIPSGRIPGTWGFWIAVFWTVLSLGMGAALGLWAFAATVVGVFFAWAYSAPPLRLKMNGWWGCSATGLCYEGLPWFTGAAVMAAALPPWEICVIAGLYAAGAHGIMTLNDFKAVEGDRALGIRSLPVTLGRARAARLACWVMGVPQLAVIALLIAWGHPWHAGIVGLLLAAQVAAMRVLLRDPKAKAPWYNGVGVGPYVLGMMTSAVALGAGAG